MIRGFWQAAKEEPNRIAVIDDDGSEVKAGDLLAAGNQLVHGLRALGFEEGDRLAVILPSCATLLEVLVANMQAGWHIVPINYHLTPSEITYILKDSGAKALIAHECFAENAIATLAECNEGLTEPMIDPSLCFAVGDISGFQAYADLKAGQSTELPENRVSGNFMQYTSGTTGSPKAVQRDIYPIAPETMLEYTAQNLTRFGIEPGNDNVFMCPSPLYHTAPMAYTFFALNFEHKLVLIEKWDAEEVLRRIEKHKVTVCVMVPTHFYRLLQLPEEVRNRYDASSLKAVLHAAAPCPKDIKMKMFEWWGNVIYEYYGATEGGGTTATPEEWLRYPGTVGKAWEGSEIRIYRDDENLAEGATHELCEANEIGLVYMKISQDFSYKGDEKKTKSNRIGDFFTVGDIGYLNEDGFLFLCDRKSNMIISGGVNIYPAEVEAVLLGHPSVGDAAVFGIPNTDFGEEVKAVVQPMNWAEAGDDFEQKLIAYCQEKLAKYKCPRSVDFMEEMPRDPNGKMYKRLLKEPYWKKAEDASASA